MKKYRLFILAVLLIGGLASCKKVIYLNEELPGSWQLKQLDFQYTGNVPSQMVADTLYDQGTFQFNSDLTGTFNGTYNFESNFTWKAFQSPAKITFNYGTTSIYMHISQFDNKNITGSVSKDLSNSGLTYTQITVYHLLKN